MIVGGGGGVGASVAFNLLIGGGEFDVVLTDRRPEMARSHVLDLEQVSSPGRVRDGPRGSAGRHLAAPASSW